MHIKICAGFVVFVGTPITNNACSADLCPEPNRLLLASELIILHLLHGMGRSGAEISSTDPSIIAPQKVRSLNRLARSLHGLHLPD